MGKRGPKQKIPTHVVKYERDVYGKTFQAIGDKYGLTRQRVHQIYHHGGESDAREDQVSVLEKMGRKIRRLFGGI